MGNKKNAYRILARRKERKGTLEKPGRKWEDNTNTNL
jgi:hypothetical protein